MTTINPLPTLDPKYNTPTSVGTGGDLNEAKELAATINQFYNGAFANDARATAADAANHIDVPENDDKVAADIATLHNLDIEFAKATGDQATLARLQAHPDQLSNTTSNKLLTAAGVNHTDQDFMYSATNLGNGQQVDAHLKSDKDGNQGTAAYQYSPSSVMVTNSAMGTTGADWALANGTTVMQGGRYDAADGQRATQNIVAGNTTAGYTPRQLADIYTYLSGLPASQRASALSSNSTLQGIWNVAASSNVGDATTNTDAFNAVYNLFAKSIGNA